MNIVNTVAPIKEISDLIKENGGASFQFCYQCGICDVVCPWNRVRQFSMRKIVRQATFGLTDIEQEDIWRCTTCGTCPQRCPRGVNQIEAGVSLRRIATEYDVFPKSVTPIVTVSGSLQAEGNPFNLDRSKRADWAEGLSVKPFIEGMEILYFPGCYLSYDPRLKKVAVATVKILNAAGSISGSWAPRKIVAEKASARQVTSNYSNIWPRKTSKISSTAASRKSWCPPRIAITRSRTNIRNSASTSKSSISPNSCPS